jgi:hypothetical protein
LSGVVVDANPNEGFYTISLSIQIPSLNKSVDIKSILSKDGYAILG